MKINFDEMEKQKLPNFKGGEGYMIARIFDDGCGRIMKNILEPGCSIGMHTHENDCEVIYILSGGGKVVFDNGEESLETGDCHYCAKGHSHSLINNGEEDMVFFATVF